MITFSYKLVIIINIICNFVFASAFCFQALILCKRLHWLMKLNIKMLLWKQHGLLEQP